MPKRMTAADALQVASEQLASYSGHVVESFSIAKPDSVDNAIELAKLTSKFSPMVGNLLEIGVAELLNDVEEFKRLGHWRRQDPDFPDVIFEGQIEPRPGIEIKAWFPLATEITGRFRDSQSRFASEHTNVALLAWVPEHLVYGRPKLIDVCICSASSIAKARDDHYFKPPHYVVLEPEDTSSRTRNLQQSNVNGYRFQGTAEELIEAECVVRDWSDKKYEPTIALKTKILDLTNRFPYRLDTNFAKIDRIDHPGIEEFKTTVLGTTLHGLSIRDWAVLFSRGSDDDKAKAFREKLNITED